MVINDVDVGNGETRDFASVSELDAYIAELRERAKAEVATAYQDAAKHAPWSDGKCVCGERYTALDSQTPFEDYARHVLSLTPTGASRAFELAILDARIEEAKWSRYLVQMHDESYFAVETDKRLSKFKTRRDALEKEAAK